MLEREIYRMDFFGIDAVRRVAQFITGETVKTGVVGIQFGAADFVPTEGFTRNMLWMNNAQNQIFFVSIKVTIVV